MARQEPAGVPGPGDLVLGHYRVRETLGSGGESTVVSAQEVGTGRPVALKILHAADAGFEELATLVGLEHPGIVRVLEADRDPALDRQVLVLEHLEGIDLLAAWRSASPGDQGRIFARLIDGVAGLHRRGIVHGDLKPDNVLVIPGPDGPRPVIVDFGMAIRAGDGSFRGGTPAYLAPEVLAGGLPDFRSDLYALGLTLLQVMQGGSRPQRTIPRRLALDARWRRILERLLATDPAHRYQDGVALRVAWGRGAQREEGIVLPARLPLVGRSLELEDLVACLRDHLAGRGGPATILLAGPEGVGRRRLLDEIGLRSRLLGVACIRRRAEEGLPAFIERALRVAGLGSAEASRRRAALEAAAIVPGLASGSLAERSAAALGTTPLPRPLVIAGAALDPEERTFLERVSVLEASRREAGEPGSLLLLVATPWPGSAWPAPARTVRLRPFDQGELADLVAAALGAGHVSLNVAALAREILAATGGLASTVEAALRGAAATGALRWADDDIVIERPLLDTVLERAAAGEVRADLLVLRGTALDLAAALALRDTPASVAQIAAVSGDADHVGRDLDDLEAAGLVVRGQEVALRGQAWRDALVPGLDPDRLRALHRRWAAILPEPQAAAHRLATGDGSAATIVLDQIGSCLQRGERRRAEHLIALALASGALPAALAPALALLRARLDLAAGRREEGLGRLRGLRSGPAGRPAVEAALVLCEEALAAGDLDLAREEADSATRGAGVDQALAVRASCARGFALLLSGRLQEAAVEASRAVRIAGRDGRLQALARNLAGLVASRAGDAGARAHLEAAVAGFESAGDELGAAAARTNLALLLVRIGAVRPAAELLEAAAVCFGRAGQLRQLALATTNLALTRARLGHPAEAAERHAEAARLLAAVGERDRSAVARASRGIALLDAGRPAPARRSLREALRDWQPSFQPAARTLAHAAAARAAALLGRVREAQREACRALQAARASGVPGGPERAAAVLAAAEISDDPRKRLRRARSALRRARALGDPELLARAELLLWAGDSGPRGAPPSGSPPALARREEVSGLQEEDAGLAVARLGRALRLARRGDDLLAQMRIRLALVPRVLEAGRVGRARSLFRKARSIEIELEEGMTRRETALFRVTRLDAELRGIADAVARRLAALDDPGGTSRLVSLTEVMRLLAALNAETSLKRLLAQVVDSALDLTEAVRGYVVLLRGEDLAFESARARGGRTIAAPADRISTSIAHEVIGTGRSLLLHDAASDARYEGLLSVAANRIRSLACVPLRAAGERVGALYLDGGDRRGVFSEAQLPLLEAYADLAALAIRNVRVRRDLESDRKRLSDDLTTQRTAVVAHREAARRAAARAGLGEMVGVSQAIDRIREEVARAAPTDLPVLVTGESGVGKELVAHAIHARSARSERPFVALNCANLNEALFESELFGHVKGAFTGADRTEPGLFVVADGGTLFLDEIGELPAGMQAKLLRALEAGCVRPVGGDRDLAVDVRIVTATNRDLTQMIEAGTFRADLWYRVKVIGIQVPALRERPEDVPVLAAHFLEAIGSSKAFTPRALKALAACAWPGNVRQLKNEVQRDAVVAPGAVIDLADLSADVLVGGDEDATFLGAGGVPLTLVEAERRLIRHALRHTGGDKQAAAKLIGISRSTLYEKLRET